MIDSAGIVWSGLHGNNLTKVIYHQFNNSTFLSFSVS